MRPEMGLAENGFNVDKFEGHLYQKSEEQSMVIMTTTSTTGTARAVRAVASSLPQPSSHPPPAHLDSLSSSQGHKAPLFFGLRPLYSSLPERPVIIIV